MASDETRRVLAELGAAVTRLEDAVDQHRPVDEIMGLDTTLADCTRDLIALVDRLRSRRIG